MPKIYETGILGDGDEAKYYVLIHQPNGSLKQEQISHELYDELQALQRELWRLEKREQRHTVHLDAIPENLLPKSLYAETPEKSLMQRIESMEIGNAYRQLPVEQQRRFALRYIFDMSIKQIAAEENCSERAVKYSLNLAKKNLRDILDESFATF